MKQKIAKVGSKLGKLVEIAFNIYEAWKGLMPWLHLHTNLWNKVYHQEIGMSDQEAARSFRAINEISEGFLTYVRLKLMENHKTIPSESSSNPCLNKKKYEPIEIINTKTIAIAMNFTGRGFDFGLTLRGFEIIGSGSFICVMSVLSGAFTGVDTVFSGIFISCSTAF